jgi:hypothetical protein
MGADSEQHLRVVFLCFQGQKIGLVANEYTKFGKTSETLLLSQGLFYMKIPL